MLIEKLFINCVYKERSSIYSAIRQGISLSGMTTKYYIIPMIIPMKFFCFFLKNPKNLDPPYKMDLDFRDCFGRKNSVL